MRGKQYIVIKSLFIFTCGVLIILIATPIITQLKLKKYTNHSEYKEPIQVPDLLGKTIFEATDELKKINLKVDTMPVSTYNPNFPKGSVVRQDPFSGDLVKGGRTIYLTLNPELVTQIVVPDFSDKSFRNVQTLFRNSKLKVRRIFYKNNIAENVVLRLNYNKKKINIGDTIPMFSKIDVYLGAGVNNRNEKTIKIPNLVGALFLNHATGEKIEEVIRDNFLNVGELDLDELDIKDTTEFFIYKQFPSPDLDSTFMFISSGGMSPKIDLYFTRDSTKLIGLSDSIKNINND